MVKGFLKEDILIINSDGLTNLVPQEEIFKQAKRKSEFNCHISPFPP